MDVAALRTEIKSWERDFKARNGRGPSVQEIKDQPAIAAKYKLYKSLSKAATSRSQSAACPSTPPRSAPRQPQPSSSIVPKARAVKVDPPVLTSNPFSPVKNRKKFAIDPSPPQRASNPARPNPFSTPSKPKNKPHDARCSPSPDLFPPIEPLVMVQRTPVAPAVDSAVTRARKRLRGEPVSPSPVKEKRPRVAPQAALSFASHAAPLDHPDVSDGDEMAADANDTIIADTPMKPRTGGRDFKVLFDDVLPNGEKRLVKSLSSRRKSSSSHNIFAGAKRERSRALTPSSDEEEDWSLRPRLKSLDASAVGSAKLSQTKGRVVNGKRGMPKALVPSKNDLWADMGPPKPSSNASSRTSNKRPLPDDLDDAKHDVESATNTFLNLPLLPPSPPPPDASKRSGPKYADKGKGKAALGRKKAKLLQDSGAAEEDEDGSAEDEIQVKEIDPLSQPSKPERRDDPDSDWEVHWRAPPDPNNPAADPGKFEVDLPDELQRVLAISPGRSQERGDEKVVRELLYGSREVHYNPQKGGEIWDVGEDEEHAGETEEEWESEPVPWEVGEL
ncbi:hypothetical protein C2E23DRAFT_851258 [Lenzites betulinus]|nr:hypothetical protein C2E23DRAFT_851258 [Lenzites betulinus]